MNAKHTREKRIRRHRRIRARMHGTAERPRMSVFRSSRYIWVQLIDDVAGHTLIWASDRMDAGKGKPSARAGNVASAARVGELIAKRALEKNIQCAVFDRGGYRYHGAVKALADGARKAGLTL
ncbi:MAG: 50S ribosomal protein L18 [Candidatus Sungbacteria bacterium]|uniref:Large ribosomal subunit protein uL18 n=1 Tax=Candidatus Sungiibacteriota bacterium TaxID=2750080 RepID=A0A932QYY6_9BACT|nr:50S ribosomal protein L18 [Candidatus Sungbacteria bacterium]